MKEVSYKELIRKRNWLKCSFTCRGRRKVNTESFLEESGKILDVYEIIPDMSERNIRVNTR